jgi:catechol 2,3-dioxygenase-like lactoylglutathione lyase family enzyme
MYRLLVIFSFLLSFNLFAQSEHSFTLTYDHQALLVKNLERSSAFYTDILKLKEIHNLTGFDFIKWFSTGNGTQLHLIKGDTKDIATNKGVHLAFSTSNFASFIEFLDIKEINYVNYVGDKNEPNIRADGVKQIYIQDPDGYWIEINDAGKK